MLPVAWQKINLVKYSNNQRRKTTSGKGLGAAEPHSSVAIDDNQPKPANINHEANQAAIDTINDGSIKTLDSVMEESFGNCSDWQQVT